MYKYIIIWVELVCCNLFFICTKVIVEEFDYAIDLLIAYKDNRLSNNVYLAI